MADVRDRVVRVFLFVYCVVVFFRRKDKTIAYVYANYWVEQNISQKIILSGSTNITTLKARLTRRTTQQK